MVEAAISMPILILAIMLLIRLFVFYFQILDTGIDEHLQALEAWDSYKGAGLKVYRQTAEVNMAGGGLLRHGVSKRIDVRAYMFNEDLMVRAGGVFGSDH